MEKKKTLSLKGFTTSAGMGASLPPAANSDYHNRLPRQDMEFAKELIRTGKREQSIAFLLSKLPAYPDDKFIYTSIAGTLGRMGERAQENGDEERAATHWQEALDYAVSGLKVDPSDIRLLSQSAKLFRQLGEYESSEAFLLRALRIDDQDKQTWTAMGELCMRWGREDVTLSGEEAAELMQDAANCFSKATEIDPADQLPWRKLEDLEQKGFTPQRSGIDLEDAALDLINNTPSVDTARPSAKLARTLDMI